VRPPQALLTALIASRVDTFQLIFKEVTHGSTDRPAEVLGMAATAAAVHGIRHDGVQVLRSGGRVARHLPLLASGARAAAGLTACGTSLPGLSQRAVVILFAAGGVMEIPEDRVDLVRIAIATLASDLPPLNGTSASTGWLTSDRLGEGRGRSRHVGLCRDFKASPKMPLAPLPVRESGGVRTKGGHSMPRGMKDQSRK